MNGSSGGIASAHVYNSIYDEIETTLYVLKLASHYPILYTIKINNQMRGW